MKKVESDYKKLYGDIPKDDSERFKKLLDSLNFNKNSRSIIIDKIHENLNIKWKTISFTIYLVPKATPRPRHSLLTNTFYVKGAKDNKDLFAKFISKCDTELIHTPCKFTCLSYFPIPSSMNSVEKVLSELGLIRPVSKPDWDNVGKTYSDMIQDTLLLDDSLIIEGISKKFYSSKPRIEITIEYMENYDCSYNENKLRKRVK